MGLDIQNAKFLSFCKRLGVDFSNTLTLGRQHVVINDKRKLCQKVEVRHLNTILEDKYADSYLLHLGANKIDVCDASSYEGANIILDLNHPSPNYLESSYSCVIDFGTLEHIFHYTLALKTAMSFVAENGHIVIATPANNLMGHGFYQLSPELFLRAFSEENGYELVKMILTSQFEEASWYDIDLMHRPTELATRFIAPNNWTPTYLMIVAKRLSIKPIFSSPPQQMSYETMWNRSNVNKDKLELREPFRKRLFNSTIINFLKRNPMMMEYRRLRALFSTRKLPDYYRVIPSKEWMNF